MLKYIDYEKNALSPLRRNLSNITAKESDSIVHTENPSPFYFISKISETTVRIKEPSIFLIGNFDY